MRYYLIIDNNQTSVNAIQMAFRDIPDFVCLAVLTNLQQKKQLNTIPELVLINLDIAHGKTFEAIQSFNNTTGIIPAYIGYTTSYKLAFTAYKRGFMDVIIDAEMTEKIEKTIKNYYKSRPFNKLYCINYYHDFRYLYLDNIVFLKADDYTTEFTLRDGNVLTDFKTLKNAHSLLPKNFQRIHRSYVINAHYVKRIHFGKRKIYLRHLEDAIGFSRTYLSSVETIKKLLSNMGKPHFQ